MTEKVWIREICVDSIIYILSLLVFIQLIDITQGSYSQQLYKGTMENDALKHFEPMSLLERWRRFNSILITFKTAKATVQDFTNMMTVFWTFGMVFSIQVLF